MQTDPIDDRTLIDGTGSLVTYLVVSGTLDAYYIKGDGSQLTNIPVSSLVGNPVFSNLTVTGDLIANQLIVSSSIYHVTQSYSSGSTRFGDSQDDTHQFTGSLYVTGSIYGDTIGTASYALLANTSSYISPLFISASMAAYGFGGGSVLWNDIISKPDNIVSGSGQRNILGLSESDSPRFNTIYATQGSIDGNLIVGGTITARTYVVSSSILNITTMYQSGSTMFGDTMDDTHRFTGSMYITGSFVVPTSSLPIISDIGSLTLKGNDLYIYV